MTETGSKTGPIAQELTSTGAVLFRWRSYMPLVAYSALRVQHPRRSTADILRVGAVLVRGGPRLDCSAHLRRRNRAARGLCSWNPRAHSRISVDARGVLNRPPSAVPGEHARCCWLFSPLRDVVSAGHCRVAEFHLPRADRRPGRSVSRTHLRRRLSLMGEPGACDDSGVWQLPSSRHAVSAPESVDAGVAWRCARSAPRS